MYFHCKMEHARQMAQGDQPEFWQGYCRGLLSGYLGPCAVYDEWHSRMLEQGTCDESARGYLEAFHAIEQMRGARSDPLFPKPGSMNEGKHEHESHD